MSMVGFPLLLIPLAIYNIIVFLMPGVSFTDPLVKLTLMWRRVAADAERLYSSRSVFCCCLVEIIKGARPGSKYLTDHLLSLIVFGGAAAEFLLWPRFGTSPYFLLAMLALVDFLSGIALRARRGIQVTSGAAAARREVSPAPAAARQPLEFAPAPAVPAAASVAESVLLDHPQPTLAHPEVASNTPSPEVSSPQLQPGEGSPPRDASPH